MKRTKKATQPVEEKARRNKGSEDRNDGGVAKATVLRPHKPEVSGAQVYLADERTLLYALRYPDGIRYVTSERKTYTTKQLAKRAIIGAQPTRSSRFSLSSLASFLKGQDAVDPLRLFNDLAALFRDHVHWVAPALPALLAVWVMATYVFQVFAFFPYISLNSANKRSGKSLVEEILSWLAFNATQLQVGASAATIFRDVHHNSSTVILDEVETLGDSRNGGRSLISAVLAGGFKRGGTVPRNEPNENGGYGAPTEYSTFSPKALAGIANVAAIIRDRSLAIRMVRKPADAVCERFDARQLAPTLQRHRDDLHLFGLTYASRIADVYQVAHTLSLPKLDDRGRDICEPLFSVARIIGPEAEAAVYEAVEQIAGQRRADDASTEGDLDAARTVLLTQLEWETGAARRGGKPRDFIVRRTAELFELFQEAELSGMERHADVQIIMDRLDIKSSTHRDPANTKNVFRGYRIERAKLVGAEDATPATRNGAASAEGSKGDAAA